MGVDSSLRFWFENPIIRPAARPIVIHVHRTAAIGDVDAVGAVALHQLGLLRERVRRAHMAHHQEAGDVHAKIACGLDMLLRDVRSEEHTSELQSLMRISYAVFCLKKKTNNQDKHTEYLKTK